jgi:hypothetical protein
MSTCSQYTSICTHRNNIVPVFPMFPPPSLCPLVAKSKPTNLPIRPDETRGNGMDITVACPISSVHADYSGCTGTRGSFTLHVHGAHWISLFFLLPSSLHCTCTCSSDCCSAHNLHCTCVVCATSDGTG